MGKSDITFGNNHKGIMRKILSLCLMSLLICSCLTTKGSKNAPAFRGLTGSEAERLEAVNNPGFRDKPSKRDNDDSPENLAESAEMFLQNGDFERSLYNYSKILSQNPERHDIRYKLGVALLLSGQLDEAKKELAEVLLHKMDMLEAHEALGVVFLQENNVTAAQQEFRSVLALDPKRFQSRYFLGEYSWAREPVFAGAHRIQSSPGTRPPQCQSYERPGVDQFQTKRLRSGTAVA